MKFAYVGCRTTKARNARGKGISVYAVAADGTWTQIDCTTILENPSYLAFDKTRRYLYTVHGDLNEVSAFKIKADGKLSFLNTVSSQGKNPVFLTANKTNHFLFVASLQGGAIATLPIHDDGSLGEATSVEHLEGLTDTGVSHAHQCQLDQTEQFLFVPTQSRHIGYERVWGFRINDTTGKLTRVSTVDARQYAEPRHIAFSPDNHSAYLVNEKGNAVTYYHFNEQAGTLEPRQIIPSLPETYTGEGQASAILVHPSGKFVYASNRIHESIAAYRVNEQTGFLSLLGFSSVLGKTPRFITFNHTATQLIVANEDSDTIRFFDIDATTGTLTFANKTIITGSPTCIIYR